MFARCLSAIALAAFAACGTLPAGDKDDDATLKKLQGTWKFIEHGMDGKEMPKEDVAMLTITFTGDKWAVRMGDKVVQAGTHKFDASKKPAQVDAAITDGEGKGSNMLGIYEFKGDNTMSVCFDPMGKARPTTFSSKDGRFTAVVQRVKK